MEFEAGNKRHRWIFLLTLVTCFAIVVSVAVAAKALDLKGAARALDLKGAARVHGKEAAKVYGKEMTKALKSFGVEAAAILTRQNLGSTSKTWS